MSTHRIGKYACLEIERRYLLPHCPPNLAGRPPHSRITDHYLLPSRLRLRQAHEFAEIELRNARTTLAAAQASYDASTGTTQQAQRAYEIAQVRYREGISTQTELADSRLLLQQAQAQRAQAARTLQVARLRIALLRDLPLGA